MGMLSLSGTVPRQLGRNNPLHCARGNHRIAPRYVLARVALGVATVSSVGMFYVSAGFFFRVGGMVAEELPIRSFLSPTLACIWHAASGGNLRRCLSGVGDAERLPAKKTGAGDRPTSQNESSPASSHGDSGWCVLTVSAVAGERASVP